MRANEFTSEQTKKINEVVQIAEIERLPADEYRGGKSSLNSAWAGKQIHKLPGGSGLLYSTDDGRFGGMDIKLWDPNGKDYLAQQNQQLRSTPGQLIGKLSLDFFSHNFPLKNAVKVDTITVDEDYRGMGIAKALYGIVLTILKFPLLAGQLQTPGGRRNWVSLASIPGVEVKGYFGFSDNELDAIGNPNNVEYRTQNQNADSNIDIIMGKLGGQYIGKSSRDHEFFAFDVQPNSTGKELESYVKQKLGSVYGFDSQFTTGLYAVWTNQDMIDKQAMAEGKQPGQSVVDAILKVMPTAQEIWFHGSRATGKHRRNSDTDILVVVPDDLVGDQHLGVVRILQKLSSQFDNYDIQPTKAGYIIHRIAQEEGQLLWSNKPKQGVVESLRVDVPNEEWLNDAIAYAKQKSPDRNGLPYMGKTTATVRQVEVPLMLLRRIPGMRNEQQNVRYDDLAAITKIMKDTGRLPLFNGQEYKPFINVAYDGSAWVNEGNHRIMAAYRLGFVNLPVEISYFDGGERIKSGLMFPGKIGL